MIIFELWSLIPLDTLQIGWNEKNEGFDGMGWNGFDYVPFHLFFANLNNEI